nr:hypothetical protein [Tanacetum cinerariifolium]
MKDNEVWVLVELPPNGKTVGSKWLFQKKADMDGVVHTYKARLMAKGYTQTRRIDYEETFSPVADIRAIRILIAITAYCDYEIWQIDVKTAFLNGYLNEEVYMEQPEGFVNLKYPNRQTHEVFETFKVFQKEVENQLGKPIKSLRSDRGGEYMIQEFLDHLKDHGIIAQRTPPYTPQHNGVSERRNRTLLDMVRSMMSQTTLPKSFWDNAHETVAHILNMVPTKKVKKTPYEVWHGKAPKLSYLKVWGCEALVKRDTLTKPNKLEPRSIKCIFIGYPKETMGYSVYYPPDNKVLVARNAEFLENSFINQEASGSLEDLEIIQEEDTHPSIDTSLNHEEDDLEIDEPQSDIVPIHRSTRTRHTPDHNEVWVLVELPPNGKTVGSKWLFQKKADMDGVVHTYKARLMAKGYTQTRRIDYEETFSPVADIRAIRILIAITAYCDYEIWQIDVKTAFLNGYLNEEVYMEQPEGFVNLKYPNRVCKLKRSIHRLKQASRQ